jgi:hypothetical protein
MKQVSAVCAWAFYVSFVGRRHERPDRLDTVHQQSESSGIARSEVKTTLFVYRIGSSSENSFCLCIRRRCIWFCLFVQCVCAGGRSVCAYGRRRGWAASGLLLRYACAPRGLLRAAALCGSSRFAGAGAGAGCGCGGCAAACAAPCAEAAAGVHDGCRAGSHQLWASARSECDVRAASYCGAALTRKPPLRPQNATADAMARVTSRAGICRHYASKDLTSMKDQIQDDEDDERHTK